jgi:DNA-binding transcriptional regulator YhcF (GntR family)
MEQSRWSHIRVRRGDKQSLSNQLVISVRHLIANGLVKPLSPLPSLRTGASLWGVNLHTVRRAYGELQSLGLIRVDGTRGAFVASGARQAASSLAAYLGSVLETAKRDWGAAPEDVIATLTRLKVQRIPGQPVYVVECSETFCDGMTRQLRNRLGVDAMGWEVSDVANTPPGIVVGTYFHYNEVRTALANRLDDVHFVTVRFAPKAIKRAARQAVESNGELVLCTRDETLQPIIVTEVRASLPKAVTIRPVVTADPGSLLRDNGPPVLFTPPQWDRLTKQERAHSRAHSMRVIILPEDLERLHATFTHPASQVSPS